MSTFAITELEEPESPQPIDGVRVAHLVVEIEPTGDARVLAYCPSHEYAVRVKHALAQNQACPKEIT